jgi:hypothetical protein
MAVFVWVVEGVEQQIPVYVTRRGLRLNPTRAELVPARAFASATPLPDGRVLIAGGFDKVSTDSADIALEAACDAAVYDPGTATIERYVPLSSGCRGFHRAVPLPDGSVLLVGGTGSARVRLHSNPLVLPGTGTLFSTADRYVPATGTFIPAGASGLLQRADPSAVALEDGTVIVLGGRTTDGRSDDIVVGTPGEGMAYTWAAAGESLRRARSGSRAVLLDAGVLVAGGDAWEDGDSAELIDVGSLQSVGIAPTVQVPQVVGHGLVRVGEDQALMSGGVLNGSGGQAVDKLLQIRIDGSVARVKQFSLVGCRAYHAAATLDTNRVLLAGGLVTGDQISDQMDVFTPDGGVETLTDLLPSGVFGLAAAPLPDGSVLLVGGLEPSSGTAVPYSGVHLLAP